MLFIELGGRYVAFQELLDPMASCQAHLDKGLVIKILILLEGSMVVYVRCV